MGDPIHAGTGEIIYAAIDLKTDGGSGWGFKRSYNQRRPGTFQPLGPGWTVNQLQYLTKVARSGGVNATYSVHKSGGQVRQYTGPTSTGTSSSSAAPYHGSQRGEFLIAPDAANEVSFSDARGNVSLYYNFGANPERQKGGLKRYTDAGGNVTDIGYDGNGYPVTATQSIVSGGVTTTRQYVYAYTDGLMQSATYQTTVGGATTVHRRSQYEYYADGDLGGDAGYLKRVTIVDGASNVLDRFAYRYYRTVDNADYAGCLKFAINPASYARIAALGLDPTTCTDANLTNYNDNGKIRYLPDHGFAFDSKRRATEHTVNGWGTNPATAGTFYYTYDLRTAWTSNTDYNLWSVKTTETLPDGNTHIYYTNHAHQVIMRIFKKTADATNTEWVDYYQFDGAGRETLHAEPSAVLSYDAAQSNLNVTLRPTSGLIHLTEYGVANSTPLATTTTPGYAPGYISVEGVKQGANAAPTGVPTPVRSYTYIKHLDGNNRPIYRTASVTEYRNADGTGAQTTTFAYPAWHGTSNRPATITTTLPVIPTTQNGPNSAEVRTTVYDTYGRETWFKDADGGITYREYDAISGAVAKHITDVNHATTPADFTGLPAGWTTPAGGGLHLKTIRGVDAFGRTTKETDPEGNITYSVFNDVEHSARSYPGWTGTTTTGPTVMVREDRAGSYRETLTTSAAPALSTSNEPLGTESILSANLESLTRTYQDDGNRDIAEDRYISKTGFTYQAGQPLPAASAILTRTAYGYDARGRRSSVTNAVGTITQTEYDGQDRVIRTLVGTTTGNLVPTMVLEYDNGGIGDGNVTKRTVPYSTSVASDRINQYWYDWRNRLVASKEGIEATESVSDNRPLNYRILDNLGNVTSALTYDGDALTLTVANGVPVEPNDITNVVKRRSRIDTLYDEQGRVYRRQVFSVDPSNGDVGATPLNTDFWYLKRAGAAVVKKAEPGGLVTKYAWDFAGRVTKESRCTTGNDAVWADAFNLSGESALTQRLMTYDKVGNALMVQTKDRFHDASGTGDLGTATTGVLARNSYRTSYYDKAYRVTSQVDVGTNGGVAYARPASSPSRSDTSLVTSYTYISGGWVSNITDPRGVVTRVTSDLAGRKTRVVENYNSGVNSGNPSGSDINRRTDYVYTGIDQVGQITAVAPAGGVDQVTKYAYGVTNSTYIVSNDLLATVQYPDKTTGVASTSTANQERYFHYRNGNIRLMYDGNGNVHSYYYDMTGRRISDRITTLGAGTDASVLRLDTAYDPVGRAYLFTSYNSTSASAATTVNQVQRTFNGFGQLLSEQQAPNGVINAVGAGTQTIGYVYAMPSGRNVSRLSSIAYPNGRKLRYEYGTASALDDKISRPVLLADDNAGAVGTNLEQYGYLGLGRIVKRAHPEPGIDLTRIKLAAEAVADAGDQYTGLDRFGRVVDQRWLKTSDSSSVDRFQHAYDRASNRLYQNNLANSLWSELYHANGAAKQASFDKLDRMTEFRRGTLSASGANGNGTLLDTVTTPVDPNPAVTPVLKTQVLTLDQLGNWTSANEDSTATARTHNAQNQVTAVGATAIGYDNNGNLKTQSPYAANVIDAWNQPVSLRGATYRYDALGRRIMTGSAANGEFYYYTGDQIIETIPQGTSTKRREQVVWSLEYIDCAVLRDRDADGSAATGTFGKAASGLEERLYYLHDVRYSTTALVTHAGTIVERAVYDPYGGTAFFTGAGAVLTNTAYDNTITYTGRYRDATGLIYFRARYYDPVMGRFISRDPARFVGGMNVYCAYYVPYGMDPWGLDWFDDLCDASAGLASGLTGGLTDRVNRWTGSDEIVDHSSGYYSSMQTTGTVAAYALPQTKVFKAINAAENALGKVDAARQMAAALESGNPDEIKDALKNGIGQFGPRGKSGGPQTNMGAANRGMNNPAVRDAAARGRQAHRDFAEQVKQKPGWQSEQTIRGPNGEKLRPDAIDPQGRPVELKPNTPTGRRQGEKQIEQYKEATGTNGRVIYYDP